jgi:hypothetical protein
MVAAAVVNVVVGWVAGWAVGWPAQMEAVRRLVVVGWVVMGEAGSRTGIYSSIRQQGKRQELATRYKGSTSTYGTGIYGWLDAGSKMKATQAKPRRLHCKQEQCNFNKPAAQPCIPGWW